MAERDIGAMLLRIAKSDFSVLEKMLNAEDFPNRIFGFTAQQSAEKAMKAWLIHLGTLPTYTHDIQLLLDALEIRNAKVEDLRPLVKLTSFAVLHRYDDTTVEMEILDRKATIELLSALFSQIDEVKAER